MGIPSKIDNSKKRITGIIDRTQRSGIVLIFSPIFNNKLFKTQKINIGTGKTHNAINTEVVSAFSTISALTYMPRNESKTLVINVYLNFIYSLNCFFIAL